MPTPTSRRREGCGRLVMACAASCVLLVLNGALLATLLSLFLPEAQESAGRARHGFQFLLFIGPVVLLAPEWWALDRLADWLASRRRLPRNE